MIEKDGEALFDQSCEKSSNIKKGYGGKSILHMKNKGRLNGLVTSCEEVVNEGNIKKGEYREENMICYWICLTKREGIVN